MPGDPNVQNANHQARCSHSFYEALTAPLSPKETEVVTLWNLLIVPSTQDCHVTLSRAFSMQWQRSIFPRWNPTFHHI